VQYRGEISSIPDGQLLTPEGSRILADALLSQVEGSIRHQPNCVVDQNILRFGSANIINED
jgi:hypothetical protein